VKYEELTDLLEGQDQRDLLSKSGELISGFGRWRDDEEKASTLMNQRSMIKFRLKLPYPYKTTDLGAVISIEVAFLG